MTKGPQITEVVCKTRPKIFCLAMVHALKLQALYEFPFKNPGRGNLRAGVGLLTKLPNGNSMMLALAFCPWCGSPIQ